MKRHITNTEARQCRPWLFFAGWGGEACALGCVVEEIESRLQDCRMTGSETYISTHPEKEAEELQFL